MKRRGAAFWVLASILFFAACQPSPGGSSPGNVQFTTERLRAEGDERLAQGDYEGALEMYRNALRRNPNDLPLRYLLGVALSYLGRRDEAIAAFRWVVEHGRPGREEVLLARDWLLNVGIGDQPVAVASPPSQTSGGTEPPTGRLQGKIEWAGLDPNRPIPQLQILLDGDEPSTRGRRYWTKVPLNQPYEFVNMLPGRYRLSAQVGMTRLWDTHVTVKENETTVVDLTPSTSIASPRALLPS